MAGTLGLVLAGGRGSRLGAGVPKALATLGGVTLLDRAVALARSLCGEVRVCAPADLALEVPPALRIADAAPEAGPLAGLVAGLASTPYARALVLGVDLPLLRADALAALGERLGDAAAVVPAPGGVPQPLAAWYAPEAAGALARAFAAGERSVTRAVLALAPRLVGADALAALPGGEAAFLNVNTRDDLARAEAALTARARETTGAGA